MNLYQQIVSVSDLSNGELRQVLELLLDKLNLHVVMEKTPDYVSFELTEKDTK